MINGCFLIIDHAIIWSELVDFWARDEKVNNSIAKLVESGAFRSDTTDSGVWMTTRPFLIATPVVIGVVTIAISLFAYQLYREFAWDILKQIGADYRMKKRFLYYQVSAPNSGSS